MSPVIKEEQMEELDLNYWQPESLPSISLPSDDYNSYTDMTSHVDTYDMHPQTQDTALPSQLPPTFQPCTLPVGGFPTPLPPSEYISSTLTPNSYEFTPTKTPLFAYPSYDSDHSKQDNRKIQDEVTRAAKTLFKKRNRTLFHWLNPGLNKAHLKFDTNSAWDSLPQSSRDVYVAQVLGKLAPYASSLMVNPCLKSSDEPEPANSGVIPEINNPREYQIVPCPPIPRIPRQRKVQEKKPKKQKPIKRKVIYLADDENSSDTGLVVDLNSKQSKPKRKYIRRKPREKPLLNANEGENSNSSSCVSPVEGKKSDSKLLTNKTEQDPPQVNGSTSSSCAVTVGEKELNVKPVLTKSAEEQPRVKRKYIKRKLVRKPYTRKAPYKQCTEQVKEEEKVMTEQVAESTGEADEVDLWLELENNQDFCQSVEMMTENVDSFWATIEDPSNLFVELDI